jgi:hypothetical protein
MKRRNLILLASTGMVAIALPAAYFKYEADKREDLIMPLPLTDILDVKTLRRIGKQYRLQFPKEAGPERLLELLLQDNPKDINLKIQQDYDNNRVVVLEGWILSVTEGRQSALFSFSKNRIR